MKKEGEKREKEREEKRKEKKKFHADLKNCSVALFLSELANATCIV